MRRIRIAGGSMDGQEVQISEYEWTIGSAEVRQTTSWPPGLVGYGSAPSGPMRCNRHSYRTPNGDRVDQWRVDTTHWTTNDLKRRVRCINEFGESVLGYLISLPERDGTALASVPWYGTQRVRGICRI